MQPVMPGVYPVSPDAAGDPAERSRKADLSGEPGGRPVKGRVLQDVRGGAGWGSPDASDEFAGIRGVAQEEREPADKRPAAGLGEVQFNAGAVA